MQDHALRLCRVVGRWSWVLNAALLIGAMLWIFLDAHTRGTIETLPESRAFVGWMSGPDAARSVRPDARMILLIVGLFLGLATLVAMFASLLVGTQLHRSIRSWMLFVCLLGGWLGLNTFWLDLHWRGQQIRVMNKLSAFEQLVQTLRVDWPQSDGEVPDLGVVLAYPKEAPSTLLLAGGFSVGGTRVASVTSSPCGILRFELAGGERGSWLQWSPREEAPSTFVDGLETRYQVQRAVQLDGKWFLVWYTPGRTAT